jgi:hypothetical protein
VSDIAIAGSGDIVRERLRAALDDRDAARGTNRNRKLLGCRLFRLSPSRKPAPGTFARRSKALQGLVGS